MVVCGRWNRGRLNESHTSQIGSENNNNIRWLLSPIEMMTRARNKNQRYSLLWAYNKNDPSECDWRVYDRFAQHTKMYKQISIWSASRSQAICFFLFHFDCLKKHWRDEMWKWNAFLLPFRLVWLCTKWLSVMDCSKDKRVQAMAILFANALQWLTYAFDAYDGENNVNRVIGRCSRNCTFAFCSATFFLSPGTFERGWACHNKQLHAGWEVFYHSVAREQTTILHTQATLWENLRVWFCAIKISRIIGTKLYVVARGAWTNRKPAQRLLLVPHIGAMNKYV